MSVSVSHREYATDSARWNQLLSREDLPFCPVESFLPHERALRVYALSGRSWLTRFRQAVNLCRPNIVCGHSLRVFGSTIQGVLSEHSLRVFSSTTQGVLSEHSLRVFLVNTLFGFSVVPSKAFLVNTLWVSVPSKVFLVNTLLVSVPSKTSLVNTLFGYQSHRRRS